MTRFVKLLDLPDLPRHLWPDIDQLTNNQVTPIWTNRPRTCTKDGEIIGHSRYSRFDISAELKSWVDTNITNEYVNIGLSYMWGEPVNLPHTDHTRDVTMLYLFDTGGPSVETKFWQRQGYPIHHENTDENYNYNPQQPSTYDDLDLLYTEVLKPNRWYILDARCIHSIEGMTGSRISLQLGFLKGSTWAQQIFGEELQG